MQISNLWITRNVQVLGVQHSLVDVGIRGQNVGHFRASLVHPSQMPEGVRQRYACDIEPGLQFNAALRVLGGIVKSRKANVRPGKKIMPVGQTKDARGFPQSA